VEPTAALMMMRCGAVLSGFSGHGDVMVRIATACWCAGCRLGAAMAVPGSGCEDQPRGGDVISGPAVIMVIEVRAGARVRSRWWQGVDGGGRRVSRAAT